MNKVDWDEMNDSEKNKMENRKNWYFYNSNILSYVDFVFLQAVEH